MAGPFQRLLSVPRRVARWLFVSRPIRFTRFGTFYILFSIGIGAAAINTGNNLLYLILGILLGFIVVSGFLSDSSLWGLTSEWILPRSLYANQAVPVECRLRKGWFPAVLVQLTAYWDGADPTTHLIYWIGGKKEVIVRFHLTPLRRGWLSLDRVEAATLFPFGLFQKFHTYARHDRWLVYPTIQSVDLEASRTFDRGAAANVRRHRGMGEVPYLLRDYRSGDSARLIHWKSTARRQRYIVKEMEEHSAPSRRLFVSHWPSDLTHSETEDLISFCASLVHTAYQTGYQAGFAAPGFQRDPSDSPGPVYRYLALLHVQTTGRFVPANLNGTSDVDIVSLWRMNRGR